MQLIYQNFDKLDVTFQGTLPMLIRESLANAKLEAQRVRKSVPLKLLDNFPIMVGEAGAKGGYAYRFDTGIDGEIWFIAETMRQNYWGIRISVSSLGLALYGYENCKNRILARLNQLNAVGNIDKNTGLIKHSISRIDYCFDFSSPDFQPNPELFIAHSNMRRKLILNYYQTLVSRGRKLETATIGAMPGKQVIIYDKIKEINKKHKKYWWDLWKLNQKDFSDKIWRLEIRAGKEELRRQKIKSFEDLEENVEKLISKILREIRYVQFSTDKNISRWPNAEFWDVAIKATKNIQLPYLNTENKQKIFDDNLNEIQYRYERNIIGQATSYAAAMGRDISEMPEIIGLLENQIISEIKDLNNPIHDKFNQAEQRFSQFKAKN